MTTLATSNGADPLERSQPGLYDQIAAMLPGVQEEIAALDAERTRVSDEFQVRLDAIAEERRAALDGIETKRKRLNSLLRAMGEEPVETQIKRKRGRPSRAGSVGSDKVLKFLTYILDEAPELFSTLGVHESLGATWHASASHQVFVYLRNQEFIGKVRKESLAERTHGRMLWRILDRSVGERLRAELTEKVVEV